MTKYNTNSAEKTFPNVLNRAMEDSLNARYGHLLPGMAEGSSLLPYGRQ